MFRNVTLRLISIYYLCQTFLSIDNKSTANAIAWPECGEFVFPKDDINLSAKEKQFRRKLPTLFDSYDGGNTTGIENTLKSLEKFNVPFATERKNLAKQTLSPTQDIVSGKKVEFEWQIKIDIEPSKSSKHFARSSKKKSSKRFIDSVFLLLHHRHTESRMMDILPKLIK